MSSSAKIWFITGVSGGLGLALAEAVLARGDTVIGTMRQAAKLDPFNALAPGRAHGLLLDVTDARLPEIVMRASNIAGRIDVLVNNAGYSLVGAVEEVSGAEAEQQFATNFFGPMALIQAVLPQMRQQGQGHIINISSIAGMTGYAGLALYNASKFALEGLSEGLALELAPFGIKVTIVEPGAFRTNFAGSSLRQAERTIPEYEVSSGLARTYFPNQSGKQEGDPHKAARAIIAITEAPDPPLRLLLGEDALATADKKIAGITRDLEAWKDVSAGTGYDDGKSLFN